VNEGPPRPDLPVDDETLEAFAAGELDASEAERLRARVARDPHLAARLRAVLRVEAALRDPTPSPVPLGLVASVRARLDESPATRDVRSIGPRRPALAATAAAVLVGLVGWSTLGGGQPFPLPGGLDAPAVSTTVARLVGPAVPTTVELPSLLATSWLPDFPSRGPVGLLSVALGVGFAFARARSRAGRPSDGAPTCAS
jgi:anti-sigma factor RsiW